MGVVSHYCKDGDIDITTLSNVTVECSMTVAARDIMYQARPEEEVDND